MGVGDEVKDFDDGPACKDADHEQGNSDVEFHARIVLSVETA
jgi:hypothetical protein